MRKLTRTVTVNKPVEVKQVVGVELELTVEELAFLAIVMSKIGGCRTSGLRRYAETISAKLSEGGVSFMDIPNPYNPSSFVLPDDRGRRMGITFEDDTLTHDGFVGFVNRLKENTR